MTSYRSWLDSEAPVDQTDARDEMHTSGGHMDGMRRQLLAALLSRPSELPTGVARVRRRYSYRYSYEMPAQIYNRFLTARTVRVHAQPSLLNLEPYSSIP